ncbi:MAG: class I SAM-dependent methyltransferase [Deltaproteobacteria bacterium]|nr:class I SAM-dependent methyltransferase [Deltaproteobacteria bacterium]
MSGPDESIACECCGGTDHESVTHKRGWKISRCSDCSLFFLAPQPTDAEISEIYSTSEGYYTRVTADLRELSPERARGLDDSYRALGIERGRFLDVGCAHGALLYPMRALGWTVQGNDLNAGALDIARTYGFEVRQGQLEDCGFEPESFDAIHLGDLIEHVRSPRRLVQTVLGLLRPGGIASIVTPNADSGFATSTLALSRRTGIAWAHSQAPYHLYEFTPNNLRRLLHAEGLAVERLTTEGAGSFPYLVGATGYFDALKPRLKHRGRWKLDLGVATQIPTLAAVTASLLPAFAYGKLTARQPERGRIITAFARRA